jgi:Domain of unknown function (DUF4394)
MPCPARAQRPPPTRRRPDATREAGSCAVDGQVVGVGTVYSINPTTGVATPINTGFPLTGPVFGVDFDPVANELRIVGLITGPNLRILNGGTGAVIVDTPLSPDTPHVVGAAYSNNFAGATSTTLYDIDNQGPVVGLVLQTQGSPGGSPVSPNSGTLFPVGPLGVITGDPRARHARGPGHRGPSRPGPDRPRTRQHHLARPRHRRTARPPMAAPETCTTRRMRGPGQSPLRHHKILGQGPPKSGSVPAVAKLARSCFARSVKR